MKQYIYGYYCANDKQLDVISKQSNRRILEALREALPLGLNAHGIVDKTGLPLKTVYASLRELNQPANPNQLSTELGLDYKTIIHHLSVLVQNGLVITDNKEAYGATYFLTPLMEKNYNSFKEILAKLGKK